jgi:hypothetical protein
MSAKMKDILIDVLIVVVTLFVIYKILPASIRKYIVAS